MPKIKILAVRMAKGFALILIGSALGAGAGVWWAAKNFSAANEIAMLRWAAAEGEAAMEQYLFSKPEVAAYALERFSAFLRPLRESKLRVLDSKVVNMDLGLALGRLGLVQERQGDTGRAAELYGQALEAFEQAGKKLGSVDELKRMIERLDEPVRRNWKRKSQS